MTRTEALSHPAIEVKLPIDGSTQKYVVPTETTLFFWGAIAPGTHDRLAPSNTPVGFEQMCVEAEIREQISWSVRIDGETVPLLADSTYRKSGYHGLAWWIAHDAVELPTVVNVHFETTGEQPTVDGDPIALWTETGTRISWNDRIKSTIQLLPPDNSDSQFATHRENLWNDHLVYEPRQENI